MVYEETYNVDVSKDVSVATAVVGMLMAGAFILSVFEVPSILDLLYWWILGEDMPQMLRIAINSAALFTFVYPLVYIVFYSPLKCYTNSEAQFEGRNIDFTEPTLGDILFLILSYVTFLWVGIPQFDISLDMYVGAFIIILYSTFSFFTIPRVVSRYVPINCFFAIQVILISLPIVILIYIPFIFISGVAGI